ncbi:DUF6153 family protein [Arthrobacter sp. LAPM80]|uniref:DUF6153 family protein n=1 Tax=Arthrobacter sp. LAPM80 TaxID=3141788 RepID=UPI00398B6BCA
MRSCHDVSTTGSLLRWGGLLSVVLAIVTGLLGMHMIGGAQAAPVIAVSMSVPALPPALTAQSAAESAHAMPSGCEATMAMHGACVPSIGPAVLSVPPPVISTQLAAPAVFAPAPGHKSGDRAPDPPSLNQLSISRT